MSTPVWSGWLPPESLALLAAATWATASLFSAAASARMGAFAFTRWRMVFAALLLWGMALATGQWRSLWSDGGSAAWQAIGLLWYWGLLLCGVMVWPMPLCTEPIYTSFFWSPCAHMRMFI